MFNKKKKPEEKVKLSTPEEEAREQKRKRINRWSWRIAWWMLFLAVVVSVYFLGKTTLDLVLEKTVYTNQMFTVRAVDVRVFGGVSKERVLEFLDVKIGEDNLMALDLGQIKNRLESVSVLEKISVERVIPDTLKVQVYARVPVFRCYVWEADPMNLNAGQWVVRYLDDSGYVMAPDELFYEVHAPERLLLPTLTGVADKNVLIPNRYCKDQQVNRALKFLRLYKESSFFGFDDLTEVNISELGFIIARTAQYVEAVFDANSLELGLARWEAIYAYSTGLEQKIKTINLSVSNNVPVVWEPPPAQEDRNSRSNRVRGVRSTGGR
ncbi:MAG: FtsQ-type POTRA domain-containing protein [Verrucomicrobiae bacterium]|nr:FtsQ-type POTRA domain-containing protein [Verrucomicrobiae bacterium]